MIRQIHANSKTLATTVVQDMQQRMCLSYCPPDMPRDASFWEEVQHLRVQRPACPSSWRPVKPQGLFQSWEQAGYTLQSHYLKASPFQMQEWTKGMQMGYPHGATSHDMVGVATKNAGARCGSAHKRWRDGRRRCLCRRAMP